MKQVVVAVTFKGGYYGGNCRLYLDDVLAGKGDVMQFKEGKYVRGLVKEFINDLLRGDVFNIALKDRDISVSIVTG
jgi:hypothetical protein